MMRIALACQQRSGVKAWGILWAGTVAGCLLFGAAIFGVARGRYEVREIRPGIFVWLPEDIRDQDGDPRYDRAANAGFIITNEGVVVINTTNSPFHARELLYEIRRRTESPVRYVINTDPEGASILGNEVFADQETMIISTPAALSEMRNYQLELRRRIDEDYRMQARMRGIHLTLPNQTFDPEMVLTLGGFEIKILNLAPTAAPGDSVVYIPAAKVVICGALLKNGYVPRVGNRNVATWIEMLRRLESWDAEVFVPGQGPPGSKAEVAEFRQFLEWLTGEVELRMRQGMSLPQIRRQIVITKKYLWRARELAPLALEAVYAQLISSQSPRP